MPQYYIAIKKKGAKKYSGAIPAKKGVTLAKLRSFIKKSLRKGLTARILTRAGVIRLIKQQAPKPARRRVAKPRKRRVM